MSNYKLSHQSLVNIAHLSHQFYPLLMVSILMKVITLSLSELVLLILVFKECKRFKLKQMKIPSNFSLIRPSSLMNRFKKMMVTLNYLKIARSTTIISVKKTKSTSVPQSMLTLDAMTSLDVIFSGLDSRVLQLLISVQNQKTKMLLATKQILLTQYQLRRTVKVVKAIKPHMMVLQISRIKVISFSWLVPIGKISKRILIQRSLNLFKDQKIRDFTRSKRSKTKMMSINSSTSSSMSYITQKLTLILS